MSSQGPNACNNPSQIDTTGFGTEGTWSNLTNVEVQDGNCATIFMSVNNLDPKSEAIVAQGFGFSIPSAATINGIVATIVRGVTSVITDGVVADLNVQLLNA